LNDSQSTRGAAEAASVGDREEILDLPDVHCRSKISHFEITYIGIMILFNICRLCEILCVNEITTGARKQTGLHKEIARLN
jgi:hypothetical protein